MLGVHKRYISNVNNHFVLVSKGLFTKFCWFRRTIVLKLGVAINSATGMWNKSNLFNCLECLIAFNVQFNNFLEFFENNLCGKYDFNQKKKKSLVAIKKNHWTNRRAAAHQLRNTDLNYTWHFFYHLRLSSTIKTEYIFIRIFLECAKA
jgi:hypothetical protein